MKPAPTLNDFASFDAAGPLAEKARAAGYRTRIRSVGGNVLSGSPTRFAVEVYRPAPGAISWRRYDPDLDAADALVSLRVEVCFSHSRAGCPCGGSTVNRILS